MIPSRRTAVFCFLIKWFAQVISLNPSVLHRNPTAYVSSHIFPTFHLCLLSAFWSWLKCAVRPLCFFLSFSVPNQGLSLAFSLSLHASLSPPSPSDSELLLPCSVLRGWGQWRMARVAMTTPGALTARMASMGAANSCACSSLCPSKMTQVPAMCSCFAGENNQH